ncbi:hypothetical protein PG994_012875 [Apiospora phragmitis]|uniref:Uncharacterized protein n=1 Tax=Apiospora phragmitis TaxID=2905665 RepID=A0ABR1T727_9PEZI
MASIQFPGGFGGLMMTLQQPSHTIPGMTAPDVSSCSSPLSSPQWANNDPTEIGADDDAASIYSTPNALLTLVLATYAMLCTLIVAMVIFNWTGPRSRPSLPHLVLFLCTAVPTLAVMAVLPLVAAHLLLQFVVWVCLDAFLLAVRHKRRQGLLPLYRKPDHERNTGNMQKPQQQRNSNKSSPHMAIRFLKNYVELPPLRWRLRHLRYAPDSIWDWRTTANCSPPPGPMRERRQVLQYWWNSQQYRRQRQQRHRGSLLAQYNPALPPEYESAEPLFYRPTTNGATKGFSTVSVSGGRD